MYTEIEKLRADWTRMDTARDMGLTVPEGLQRWLDLPYGSDAMQKLDIYCPEHSLQTLPTIISIHGGGWFYGDKEIYAHYCMALAKRGFTVVNFSYRLAPENKYPAALEDICSVLHWMRSHGPEYRIDLNNLFMVGDSAGGQLCYQICTMLTNPEYADLFAFSVPQDLRIRACGLNCGCYFIPISRLLPPKRMGAIFEAYFPEAYLPIVPQLRIGKYVTKDFPPAFVTSAQNDYLKFMARPMYRLLRRKGVEARLEIYGAKEQKNIGHVFHLNCRSEVANRCNDSQCAFFRSHMA